MRIGAVITASVLIASSAALVTYAAVLNATSVKTIANVWPVIALLSLPAALGLAFAPKLARLPQNTATIQVIFVIGLMMRLLWFGTPAPLEDDYHRYLWDGAVLASGHSPYRYAPATVLAHADAIPKALEVLAAAHGATLSRINFPGVTTIYPGTGQMAFVLANWIAPFDIDGLRTVFLICEILTFALITKILCLLGRSPAFVALYWCNPLVVFVLIGTVHMDAMLPPLLLGSCLAVAHMRPTLGAGLLGLAVGVKLWPVLLAPIAVRPIMRNPKPFVWPAIVFLLTAALTVLPVMAASLTNKSGLTAYAAGWHSANAFYEWMSYAVYLAVGESDMAQRVLRACVALAAVALAGMVWLRPPETLEARLTGLLSVGAIVFYFSPAQFPWYAIWFLAPAAVLQCWPLLAASLTLPSYYLFFPLWESGRGPLFSYGVAFVHSLPVIGLLLRSWLLQRRGDRHPGKAIAT